MNKEEINATLRSLIGTEAARAVLGLLTAYQEKIKDALTEATGDEIVRLQGEYRLLVKLKKSFTPTERSTSLPGGYD